MVEPIGNTPLLRLRDPPAPPVSTTPSSSSSIPRLHQGQASQAHDRGRPARGELTPGKVILDSTLGNTGIAFAMTGAARAASSRTTRMFLNPTITPPTGRRTDDTTAPEMGADRWAQHPFCRHHGNQGTAMGVGAASRSDGGDKYRITPMWRGGAGLGGRGSREMGKPEEVERWLLDCS